MTVRLVLELLLIGAASFAMSYIGAAVGLVLGHFRVVLFTYGLGGPVAGTATSMAVSTMSTVAGAVEHARGGRVERLPVLLIGVPSALAAYVAARFAGSIEPRLLKLAIAGALVFSTIDLLRAHGKVDVNGHPHSSAKDVTMQVAIGVFLGAISGLVGLLMGTVRLPAMVKLGVRPATAVGTNMVIGALTGFSGGASALLGGHIDFKALAVVAPLAVLGSHFGAKRTGKLDPVTLTRWIAGSLVLAAAVLLGDVFVARA